MRTMIEIAEDAEDPLEPWELVKRAVERTDVTTKEARQTLRDLTHGKRSERELVHALDGRIVAAE